MPKGRGEQRRGDKKGLVLQAARGVWVQAWGVGSEMAGSCVWL